MKTGEMPILALCRTAVDADIEGHLAEHLRHSIYEYLKTDTLLFHDDTYVDEHGRLIMPLINNFTDKFEMNIKTSSTFEPPVCEINPNFENWLHSLNNWQLIGM
jgi:chaperone required for assembly of F1-ATPase